MPALIFSPSHQIVEWSLDMKHQTTRSTIAAFSRVTAYPKVVIMVALAFIIIAGAGLQHFHKETSVDSFIPTGDPSVVTRDQVKEIFGLKDPVVLALDASKAGGIFTPKALNTLRDLELMLQGIPAIQPYRQKKSSTIQSDAGLLCC